MLHSNVTFYSRLINFAAHIQMLTLLSVRFVSSCFFVRFHAYSFFADDEVWVLLFLFNVHDERD